MTDPHDEIRKQAIEDLQHYLPGSHCGRAFQLEADIELASLAFNATGREGRAAHALLAQARYETLKRSMLASTMQPVDGCEPSLMTRLGWTALKSGDLPPLPSREATEKVDAHGKMYRDAALRYARDLGDPQLIEDFQPQPTNEDGTAGWLVWTRHFAAVRASLETGSGEAPPQGAPWLPTPTMARCLDRFSE